MNRKEEHSMNNFNYCSIYSPFFKRFISMKEEVGSVAYFAKWLFLDLDKFFIDNNITTIGITSQQIDAWRATRINDSPTTIYNKYCIISQFCKYMCKVGYDCYIPRKPVDPSKNNFTPYIYSDKEMADIFQACDNMRLYDKHMSTIIFILPTIIRLLYSTGLRVSEALSLKNKDVDFDRRCLIIRKSKNGQERIAPLSDSLEIVLKQYLQYRDSIPILRIKDNNGYLFVSPDGTSCHQWNVYTWFRKALAISGIPYIGDHHGPRVHDLRHTFAVHAMVLMAKSGQDLCYTLPILSIFLGHKSLGATEKYVRLTSEMYPDLLKDEKAISAYVFPNYQN